MYFVGAETQGTKELSHYQPKRDEVLRYLRGCMDIILQDLQGSKHPLNWDEVFENNLLSWVDTGLGDTLLGYVEQVCELKQWDWVKLRKNIDFAFHSRKDRIRPKDAEKLEGYIEGLPELYRTIARMRLLDGLQYKEISEELGIELNTVRTRIRRAKAFIEAMKGDDESR